jgi:hypothetical protein
MRRKIQLAIFALVALVALVASASAQFTGYVGIQSNVFEGLTNVTAAGTSAAIPNTGQGTHMLAYCIAGGGGTATAVAIQLEASMTGASGTFFAITTQGTATSGCNVQTGGEYFPYIRINLVTFTPNGTHLSAWYTGMAMASPFYTNQGGGGGSSNVTIVSPLDGSGYVEVDCKTGCSGASNPAAGPTGSAVPADGSYEAFNSGGNLVGVSSANPFPVTIISGSAGNPAAGATGSAVPADASYNGLNIGGTLRGQTGVNPTGSVYAAQMDITSLDGTALAAPSAYGTAPTGNVWGGNVFVTNVNANGQAAMSASAPVVVASNQSPIPVSQNNSSNSKTNPILTQAADGTNSVTLDPCAVNAGTPVNINLTASGQLITGTSGKQTYICALDVQDETAVSVALVEGTGTTCGTSTAGMGGGSTAATGWNFAANSGMVVGTGANWVRKTVTTGDNVCLLLSGTSQISGGLRYVQQ